MPNWVQQGLYVAGPKSHRKRLVEWWLDHDRKFCNVAPYPLDLLAHQDLNQRTWQAAQSADALIKKYGVSNEYDWACRYWGSKWGDCDTEIGYPMDLNQPGVVISAEIMKKVVRYERTHFSFRSAWSPSTEIFIELSRRFPRLVFGLTAVEEQPEFAEWAVVQCGQVVDRQSISTEVPYEIVQMLENEDYGDYEEWLSDLHTTVHDGCIAALERVKEAGKPLVEFTG